MVVTNQNDIDLWQFLYLASWRSVPFLHFLLSEDGIDDEIVRPDLNDSRRMTYPSVSDIFFSLFLQTCWNHR